MDQIIQIPLEHLHRHPRNSNVMPADLFEKLVDHIARSGRYPPILVRPLAPGSSPASSPGSSPASAPGACEILDGHHRAAALRRLKRSHARCVVWDVGEEEALLLLATLNRLEGHDDPRKRGALLDELMQRSGAQAGALARRLPESADRLRKLIELTSPPPPRPPGNLADMPVAVHFFLLPAQRRELEACLRALGGGREAALMALVKTRGRHGGEMKSIQEMCHEG